MAVQTKGPAATLEVLYRAENIGMVRLAAALVGGTAEDEEIVQESFVEISAAPHRTADVELTPHVPRPCAGAWHQCTVVVT